MNSYDLSRNFWDWAFENPDKIKPNHSAMFFFAVEYCNRLGWKEKFTFRRAMVMEAIGIKSYNTFIDTLNDLIEFGFIEMVEKSKNQYSANIIALSNFNKALDKANDKALDKALIRQSVCSIKKSESTIQSTVQSTVQSIDIINKTINNKPINQDVVVEKKYPPTTTRDILFSKPISINQWAMKTKVDETRIKECIIEFSEFKERTGENEKWQNDSDLIKNFEFWLNSNARAKIQKNQKNQSNEQREIYRNA